MNFPQPLHYTHPLSLCKNDGHCPIPESWRIHGWNFERWSEVFRNLVDMGCQSVESKTQSSCMHSCYILLLESCTSMSPWSSSPVPTNRLFSPLCCMVATLGTTLLALLSPNQSVLLTSACVMSYCPVPNGQSVYPKLLSELQHANIMDTAIVQAVEEGQES